VTKVTMIAHYETMWDRFPAAHYDTSSIEGVALHEFCVGPTT
jgi:hypothetical protein